MVVISDSDRNNHHITDLYALPTYHPTECPFIVKRGQTKLQLVDVLNKQTYLLFEDNNNKWGYCKVAISSNKSGRFKLFFVVNEGETD